VISTKFVDKSSTPEEHAQTAHDGCRHTRQQKMEPYGAPWLQPVAIGGKCDAPNNAENKPNPSRLVATGCLRHSMVRRSVCAR
jgi:hypothetical protein